jgi:hypothetical protein
MCKHNLFVLRTLDFGMGSHITAGRYRSFIMIQSKILRYFTILTMGVLIILPNFSFQRT